ncbi:Aberrant root formation protein [Actinidia chinensis var. chinensis]|uniref:Aberrant root formation protein n=1 Tax=Actinidia chinensis var. chinensis TaxID=1590841 RepID=A0A2R6QMP6_ACTCC|nr:Aberrant root formation protein [Actinidia chinensis var. chinensis]
MSVLNPSPPPSQSLVLRLQQALISCAASVESGNFSQSDSSISELVDFLNSVDESLEMEAFQVLTEIYRYMTSPSLDQTVMDALSFELPKAVARFACVSRRCSEIAGSVIDRFIESCSPRDMLSVLCEALDSPSRTPGYFAPLLSGLTKVFVSIQRRQFEQLKEAVPVIINVLKATSSEADERDADYEDLLNISIDIAVSIQAVCVKLEGKLNDKLHALLALYVLQVMALVSIGIGDKVSSCCTLMSRLSYFLRCCNLSYLGLITGCDVDNINNTVVGEDGDSYMGCFSHVKHGACLAVIWGYISNEVAQAAEEDLVAVKAELSSNQTKRWQALGMLGNIFSCINLPWELKKQAINFLLSIFDGNVSHEYDNEHVECLSYMPSLFATLQAVQMVIIYAPDAVIRKNAFCAFRKVLADMPTPIRFDIIMALIKNTDSSSMVAILIDCVREEMRMENCQRISIANQVIQAQSHASSQSTAFWNAGALELVELVVRPPKGGPPSLPEYGDAVLSALNLYRFVFITESTGNTNYTGVLSEGNLQKAYNEWLLPLRSLVTGIMAENQKGYDQLAEDTVCALSPLELVLYRCIELVEEKLKHAS